MTNQEAIYTNNLTVPAAEEGEHGVHVPSVEEPKRRRVAPARNEQRLIGMVIVDAHNQYIVKAGSL